MKKIKLENGQYIANEDIKTGEIIEIEEKSDKTEKQTIKILDRYNKSVIYESEKTTIKEVVEEAIEKGINLESANLESANLKSANLEFANLEFANLKSANLKSAILESANLKSANLESANLKSANLEFANLESANLKSANLESANLEFAKTSYCLVNFTKEEYEVAKVFIEGLKN